MKRFWMFCAAGRALMAAVAWMAADRIVSVAAQALSSLSPVMISDAGHGGFDGGAEGVDGTLEKDVNLSLSLKLADLSKLLGYHTMLILSVDCSV